MTSLATVWAGEWVADALDVRLTTTSSVDGRTLPDLVGLAVRRNPKRAHLLVSTVLGKHVPARPADVAAASSLLGATVRTTLGPAPVSVFGYAETATALGHGVAAALDAPYLHSTRADDDVLTDAFGFEEAHSHATTHRVRSEDPAWFAGGEPLVLVDDELSTGATALATVRAVHAVAPRDRYLMAALVDLRDRAARDAFTATAAELAVRIDVVALVTGTVELPPDVLDRAAALLAEGAGTPRCGRQRGDTASSTPLGATSAGAVVEFDVAWPRDLAGDGRHGVTPDETARLHTACDDVGARLAALGGWGDDVLVLGTEEFMYAPLRVAAALADRVAGTVRVSATTRSPALAVDDPGYALRDVLTQAAGTRFAYNVGRRSDVVLVTDAAPPADLLARLRERAGRVVVVRLPRRRPLPAPLHGPTFGSYAAADVAWLLTDFSDVALEAPTEEREEAIQSGGAHYAESLPVEYQPSAAYQRLYERALATSAERVARAVATVTELVLAERGDDVVLASLARAGTPVGVLMRRWAAFRHGLDLPHYAVSIVRGRGIDVSALRYLQRHHDPASVVWVDGWTGKGAITRELTAAIEHANVVLGATFAADLAVLADPAGCVRTFGTRADFLIPSACLNSTVSGLVSRTVLNDRILAPGRFHGAKFYRDLAGVDVSNAFLDAVAARFADVGTVAPSTDREPTGSGGRAVTAVAARYGIDDVNLVKPGVGETTRVLLRRVPWRVLLDRDAPADDVEHLRLLAAERGVAVETVEGLGYAAMGLIHPRFTRGATGATGRAAR